MPALKYTSEELKNKVEEYFTMKEKERKDKDSDLVYMSISDICSYLEITSQTWRNYKKKDDYFGTIKRAEEKIKNEWMKNLFYPGRNATGAIFYAKNTWGWSDRQEVEHTGQIDHDHSSSLLDGMSEDQLRALKSAADDQGQADGEVIDVTDD